jgi:hypothetical protein
LQTSGILLAAFLENAHNSFRKLVQLLVTMSANSKVSLSPGFPLFPGETIEFFVRTCAVALFKATGDGAFAECGSKIGDYWNASNEVI